MGDQRLAEQQSWAAGAGVLSLVGICGLYAAVISGSSGGALALCATLTLVSGSAAAVIWTTVLSKQAGVLDPLETDEDDRDDAGDSEPPRSPVGGEELDWRIFERDFREYVSTRKRPIARIRFGARS